MIRILLIMVLPICLYAAPFYEQTEQGWHWYDEATAQEQGTMTIDSAQQQLSDLQQELTHKRALALMDPSETHIKDYIQVQNLANHKAEIFSTIWQKVIMKNPELDHTLKHPTHAVARRVYLEEKQNQNRLQIKAFSEQYGIFFFFRSNCSYCHQFSPIVKMFEQAYGMTVVPVSLDGEGLPEYPAPRSNNGIAEQLNIDRVPALIAVDPQSGEVVPIAYGLVSVEDLAYRITLLSENEAAGS